MEIRQLDQDVCRDVHIPTFIIAVYALAAHQNFCHLHLGHILVLTQVSDSLVHHIAHSFVGMDLF